MSSNGEKLQRLFDVFTDQLLAEVDASIEAGIPIAAADKAAIIRFLQLNNIVYTPADDDTLKELREKLLTRADNKQGGALAALREAEQDLESLYPVGGMQ